MQDYFWNETGRSKWTSPHPSKVHLGHVFLRLGELKYKAAWSGAERRPDNKSQINALQEIIRSAAASGKIRTYVLDPLSFEFIEIPEKAWLNVAATPARFSECSMDCDHLNEIVRDRKRHGLICVEIDDVEKLMILADPTRIQLVEEGACSDGFISTYLHFMVHMAKTKPLDENKLPRHQDLQNAILREWPIWRAQMAGVGFHAKLSIVSPKMAASMATILRGEAARAAKGGGQTKK